MQKQITNRQAGFTLIELLVSVFILMTLAGVMIANFRTSEPSKRASAAKDVTLNAIRNAQNYTLTSRQISNSSCAPGGVADKSPKNFRVLFVDSSSTITLYAEDKCSTLNIVETYALPVGTKFTTSGFSINSGAGTTNNGTVQIRFDAPFAPSTYATAAGVGATFNSFQSATINLTDSNGNNAKTVVVDGISGRIE